MLKIYFTLPLIFSCLFSTAQDSLNFNPKLLVDGGWFSCSQEMLEEPIEQMPGERDVLVFGEDSIFVVYSCTNQYNPENIVRWDYDGKKNILTIEGKREKTSYKIVRLDTNALAFDFIDPKTGSVIARNYFRKYKEP